MNVDRAEIPFLSAATLAQLLKRKEVSPVEATQEYLDRIESLDDRLHSYITVAGEEALLRARQVEQEILRGEDLGPLHGVPVAVKDQCHVKGWRTTCGSRILKDYVAEHDSTVIVRLREAGTVLLASST